MRFLLTFLFLPLLVSAQELVELHQPNANKIVVKLQFRNGSVSDPAGKEGLTAMTAALMTNGGTKNQTYSEIQEMIYPMAAYYWATTDKEVSHITIEFHRDFEKQFSTLIRDLVLTPAMTEEDFTRLKRNQLDFVEKDIRASSDEEYSKMALEHLLFRGTRYQSMVEGTVSGVQAIQLDDIKSHYQTAFTQSNLVVGLAGGYSQAFKDQLMADLEQLPDGPFTPPAVGNVNQPKGMEVEIITKPDAFGSAIFMGFPMDLTRSSDDFAALMVANSWLGEHRKSYSRLYQKIRETRSMNYGDYSYIEWYENGGSNMLPPAGVPRSMNYFSIWIRPVPIAKNLKKSYPEEMGNLNLGQAHFAIRMAIRELDLLIKNGMTEADFTATVEFLKSYTKLYAQTPEEQIGYLLDSRFYGRKNWIQELDQLLSTVTLEQVNAAIRKYWQVDNMYITVVTNDSEGKPLAESMKKNLKSPMVYSKLVAAQMPAEVLTEDKEVADYRLPISSVKIIPSAETLK